MSSYNYVLRLKNTKNYIELYSDYLNHIDVRKSKFYVKLKLSYPS